MEFWEQFIGRIIDGWELVRVLNTHGPIAVFAVKGESSAEQGAMKVLLLHSAAIDDQLRQWQIAAELSHPSLLRVLGHGRAEFDAAEAAYLVTELADDNLSTALHNRALSEKETGEVLEPVLAAVAYLHSKRMVHGRIRPSNVLAIGDDVKLSVDSLLPEGQSPVFARERDGYDAPELATGNAPRLATDVWSLGALVSEALTQRIVPEVPAKLPGAYADIAEHSLQEHPEKRWSVQQIQARLRGPAVLPPAPAIVSETSPEPFRRHLAEPSLPERTNWKYAAIAGVAALVLLAVFLLARKPHQNAPVNPAATLPALAPVDRAAPEPGPPVKREPAPERLAGRKSGNRWFVVVATYARRRDAEKRAQKMSRKWPRFRVRVYEPPVENPHHLVVIGENLGRDAAVELQHRARSAGMPRDVYVKQFAGG